MNTRIHFLSCVLLTLLLSLTFQIVQAQFTDAAMVGLPSPTAASLGKFGEIPVSQYTGVPDITIPLTEVKGRSLNLNVRLRYHASGQRVNDIASWVGLGWTLEAGGVITRTVRSMPDDMFFGYLTSGADVADAGNPTWYYPSSGLRDSIESGLVDPEPDEFFFNFNGMAGQFILGHNDTAYTIPYQKLRITHDAPYQVNGFYQRIPRWTITTEDGTQYVFESLEETEILAIDNFTEQVSSFLPPKKYVSSWYLTRIISSNGEDEITFEYTTPTIVRHEYQPNMESKDVKVDDNYSSHQTYTSRWLYEINAIRLASIETSLQKLIFSSPTLREDAVKPINETQEERKLDSISVYSLDDELQQKIVLFHSYFNNSGANKRLRLDSLAVLDLFGNRLPSYSFEYDSPNLPGRFAYSVDHWGFYNGKSNSTYIPKWGEVSGADRSPDFEYAKAASLKKITYPTGGFSEFTYELNDYGLVATHPGPDTVSAKVIAHHEYVSEKEFTIIGEASTDVVAKTEIFDPFGVCGGLYTEIRRVSDNALVGGGAQSGTDTISLAPGTYKLVATACEDISAFSSIEAKWVPQYRLGGGIRIKQIKHNDGISANNDKITKYEYRLTDSSSSGVLVSEPQFYYHESTTNWSYLLRSSVSLVPLSITQGGFVGYREVTEILGSNGEGGKRVYKFRSPLTRPDSVINDNITLWPFASRTSFDWKRGQLLSVDAYNTSGTLFRKVNYSYQFKDDVNEQSTTRRFRAFSGKSNPFFSFLFYSGYEVTVARLFQSEVTTTQYDQNGQNPVTTTAQYFHENPIHNFLTKTIETNSDGSIRTTRLKYPLDYNTTSSGSGDAMVRALDSMKVVRNIYSPVIEQVVTEQKPGGSEMVMSAHLTKFKGFAASQHLPSEQLVLRDTSLTYASFDTSASSASAFTYDSRYYAQKQFEQYDTYGNLLQSKDASGIPTAYKCAFNSTVPVGKFVNALSSQTTISVFEDGDVSSWSLGAGTWSVQNGSYQQSNGSTTAPWSDPKRNTSASVDDGIFEALVRFDNAGSNRYASILKYISSNTFTRFELRKTDSKVRIHAYNGGSNTYAEAAFSFNENQWYRLRGEIEGSTARLFLDGKLLVSYTHSNVNIGGGQIGLGTFNTVASFDNVRMYPLGALVFSQTYDPTTLQVISATDVNGITTRYQYDNFQRLIKTLDHTGRAITEQNYYYSRSQNGDVFSSSDPNFAETAAYPGGAPTDGLVGHWRLEGNSVDETRNNNLNVVGTSWGRGYFGTTKTFDGTKTKYAHAPLISAYQTQRPTMTAWVKLSTTSASLTVANVNVAGAWSDGRGYYIVTNTNGKAMFFVGNASGSWKSVTGTTTLQTNTWYHLAGTYDGTYLRIFVNGVEDGSYNVGSITLSFTPKSGSGPNPSTFYIGIQHNANNTSPTNDPDLAYPFNGNIDDVRIYNRSLSAAEIKSLATPHVVTTYVDGLGRGIQTQTRLGNDNIVTGKKYDALGRDWKAFKPYQISLGANAHKYTANDSSNSNAYYVGLDNDEADTGGYPYDELEYFPDPLNRMKRQAAPGSAFRMGTGKEIKMEYRGNSSSDVTGYSANTLFKIRRKDEDDKVVDTFTDKFGNTVAMTTDSAGLNLKTTFEFDVLGSMTKSTPPKGSTWATTYKYNTLQQLREKASPDAGTVKYLYDKNGNTRLTKDANHTGTTNSVNISGSGVYAPYSTNGQFTLGLGGRVSLGIDVNDLGENTSMTVLVKKNDNTTVLCSLTTNEWTGASEILTLPPDFYYYEVSTSGTEGQFSYWITCTTGLELIYNKYDVFNRLIESGEYQSSSTSSLTQSNADNTSFPTTGQIIRSKFTYDNPSSDPLAAGQRNLKGRLSIAESYQLGTLALTTFYSYDSLSRVEWLLHKGLGSYGKKVTYTYDLQGRVTKKEYNDAQSASYNLFTYNEYDQTGRLTKVSTNTTDNPGTATKEGEYTYFAAGTTKDLKLGNNIQQVDYRYNTRDWVTRINDITTLGADSFAVRLYYNESSPLSGTTARYNGNIASMLWWNPKVSTEPRLAYRYSYDNAQRLTTAQAFVYSSGWVSSNKWNEPTVSYDQNGNISSYQRYGHNGVMMDNLTYNYWSNTNRLNYIDDAVSSGSFSSDLDDQSSTNYRYDGNGNMQQDLQKSVKLIVYDINNQPVALYKADGTKYKYYYDTQGNRVRKDEGITEYHVQGADGSTEVVVKSDGSQATHNINAASAVGQVKRNNTTWTRYYYLKDHLGSVRVIVNSSGAVDAYNDFYPFGMTMEQRSGTGNGDKRYQFVGNEKDAQTGYDNLGQRWYDGRIGKMLSVDRFADRYPGLTPYGYAANNPMFFIDVNGDSLWISYGNQQSVYYINGQANNPDGTKYKGNDKFVSAVVNALNDLSTGQRGQALVDYLAGHQRGVTIEQVTGNTGNSFTIAGQTATVSFNPSSADGGLDVNGNNTRPVFIGLGHELGHAEDYLKNGNAYDTSVWYTISGTAIIGAEKYASHVENQIRAERGVPLRAFYSHDLNTLQPDPRSALLYGTNVSKYFNRTVNIKGIGTRLIPYLYK